MLCNLDLSHFKFSVLVYKLRIKLGELVVLLFHCGLCLLGYLSVVDFLIGQDSHLSALLLQVLDEALSDVVCMLQMVLALEERALS